MPPAETDQIDVSIIKHTQLPIEMQGHDTRAGAMQRVEAHVFRSAITTVVFDDVALNALFMLVDGCHQTGNQLREFRICIVVP